MPAFASIVPISRQTIHGINATLAMAISTAAPPSAASTAATTSIDNAPVFVPGARCHSSATLAGSFALETAAGSAIDLHAASIADGDDNSHIREALHASSAPESPEIASSQMTLAPKATHSDLDEVLDRIAAGAFKRALAVMESKYSTFVRTKGNENIPLTVQANKNRTDMDLSVASSIREDSIASCHIEQLICTICKQACNSSYELDKHMRIYAHFPHKCLVCSTGFRDQADLDEHIEALAHAQSAPDSVHSLSNTSKDFQASSPAQVQSITSPDTKPVILVEVSNSSLTCRTCTADFPTSKALENHFEDTGHMGYHCDTCGKRYARASALKTHYLEHEKSINKYQCSDSSCKLVFATRASADSHITNRKHGAVVCISCQVALPAGIYHVHHERSSAIGQDDKALLQYGCLQPGCARLYDSLSKIIAHKVLWGHTRAKPVETAFESRYPDVESIDPLKCGPSISIRDARAIAQAAATAKTSESPFHPIELSISRQVLESNHASTEKMDARDILRQAIHKRKKFDTTHNPHVAETSWSGINIDRARDLEDSDDNDDDDDKIVLRQLEQGRLTPVRFSDTHHKAETTNGKPFVALTENEDLMSFDQDHGPVLLSESLIPIGYLGRPITDVEVATNVSRGARPDSTWEPQCAETYKALFDIQSSMLDVVASRNPTAVYPSNLMDASGDAAQTALLDSTIDGDLLEFEPDSPYEATASIDTNPSAVKEGQNFDVEHERLVCLLSAQLKSMSLEVSTTELDCTGNDLDLAFSSHRLEKNTMPSSPEALEVSVSGKDCDTDSAAMGTQEPVSASTQVPKRFQVSCLSCDARFEYLDLLAVHLERGYCKGLDIGSLYHIIRGKDKTKNLITFPRMVDYQRAEENAPLICIYCHVEDESLPDFESLYALNDHYKMFPHGVDLYKCPGCRSRFKSLVDLLEHVEEMEELPVKDLLNKFDGVWNSTGTRQG